MKRLLAISDGDDEFKDWSFTESNADLGHHDEIDFDIDGNGDRISPTSATDFDAAFEEFENCTV